MQEKKASLAYSYNDGLYINLTSRCPTACTFCIKYTWKYQYRGHTQHDSNNGWYKPEDL